jgi:hypothetical protein
MPAQNIETEHVPCCFTVAMKAMGIWQKQVACCFGIHSIAEISHALPTFSAMYIQNMSEFLQLISFRLFSFQLFSFQLLSIQPPMMERHHLPLASLAVEIPTATHVVPIPAYPFSTNELTTADAGHCRWMDGWRGVFQSLEE